MTRNNTRGEGAVKRLVILDDQQAAREAQMYEIWDTKEGCRVGGLWTYARRRAASAHANKLDLKYGAYRYIVRFAS